MERHGVCVRVCLSVCLSVGGGGGGGGGGRGGRGRSKVNRMVSDGCWSCVRLLAVKETGPSLLARWAGLDGRIMRGRADGGHAPTGAVTTNGAATRR